jgi:hypothetical protein
LSAVQNVSPAGQNSEQSQVSVDSDGKAAVVWAYSDGTVERIQGRLRLRAGTLTAIHNLSAPGQTASSPQVALDSDNVSGPSDVVYAWQRFDGTTQSCCYRVQTRALSGTGALSAVQNLSPPGQSCPQAAGGICGSAEGAQLGVDANGDAVFVWGRYDATTQCAFVQGCLRIQARSRSRTGALSAVQTLSVAGQPASTPQVGVDSDADAVFVWRRLDGTNVRVQARSRSAAGVLSAVQTLSAPGQDAAAPQVSADPNGGFDPNTADAAAVWVVATSPARVQAAVQIAPPPS